MTDQSDQQEKRDDSDVESENVQDLEPFEVADEVVGGTRRTPDGGPKVRYR